MDSGVQMEPHGFLDAPYSAPCPKCFFSISSIINGIKLFHMGAELFPGCQHFVSALKLGEKQATIMNNVTALLL